MKRDVVTEANAIADAFIAMGDTIASGYAAGLAAGMANVKSAVRLRRMYRRWNRLKRPVLDALAWVFGR